MFLDRTDKAILRELQNDCSITNVDLAERVALSPPACLKRVQRLMVEGVISRKVAILNPEKLGNPLHIVVEVCMERDRKQINQAFIKQIQNVPEVKECYQVTGEVDFVLIIDVADLRAYEMLKETIFFSNEHIKTFKTMISMNRAKYETQVIID
ncbi:Lrp/AsnC family transcriptional regulator [Vibrio algarum]|uniref:Lrp/AsnC family transcriptional regulator n=1 Tax=Vibrio algarum TaxID=3020714 RepID=A0ABT4YMB7_9VIBR|nr:Lrp/AsnC family transcriptional regulator [Vibrio sp. KJ40-1]MDB1122689.1 Lrp/AsnC family transcriptional regulator [Vibrio sp. KJ40-1]